MSTPSDNPFAAPPKAGAAVGATAGATAGATPAAAKRAALMGAVPGNAAGAINPYAAPRAAVVDHEEEAELADRFQRLRAAIIDGMIYIVAVLPMAVFGADKPLGMVLSAAVFLGLIAWNCVLLARNGQTIGKKASNIRIVRSDGSDAGFARLFFLRMMLFWALNAVPFIGPVFSLVNILFIFREDRRCIHDLLADTMVVDAGAR